jgi:hypothetical protein
VSDSTRPIRRRRWTAADDDVLHEQYERLSAAEIGQRLDRTEAAVWLRARTLGLDKRETVRPWTEAELEELRRRYGHEPPKVIAKHLGRTTSAVSQQAKILGVLSRKASITRSATHDYFRVIEAPEQAYILGLLAADGCVGSAHPRVNLGLQVKDAHLMEFVRDQLNPGANLSYSADGRAVLQVTSRPMVADLARFGIVPRKSRILPWPSGLGHLLRLYLLGYFDGDGFAYVIRDKYPGWGVCSGSGPFLVALKEYVHASTGVVMEKIHHRPNSDLWQVCTTGRGAFVVDEWLHQDGLGLERKRFPERVLTRYR